MTPDKPHATVSEGAPTTPSRRPRLVVLMLVAAMGSPAFQILVPSMPGLVEVFQQPYHVVQLSLMLFLIGLAEPGSFTDPLSDRFGRCPVMLAGIGIYLAGTLVCMIAPTIEALLAGRVMQAVGGCAGMVLSRAIVRDVYERDRAASMIANITVAMVVASAIGPVIGSTLDLWFGWQAVLGSVLAYGVLILGVCLCGLHETLRTRAVVSRAADLVGGFGYLLRSRRFLGYSLQVSFTSGNFIAERITPGVESDHMITLGTFISMLRTITLLAVTLADGLTVASLFIVCFSVSSGNGFAVPNGFAGAVSVDPNRAVPVHTRFHVCLDGADPFAWPAMRVGFHRFRSETIGWFCDAVFEEGRRRHRLARELCAPAGRTGHGDVGAGVGGYGPPPSGVDDGDA